MTHTIVLPYLKQDIVTLDCNPNGTSRKRRLILLLFLCLTILLCMIIAKDSIYWKRNQSLFYHISQPKLLDGCRYVYIDMGTNIGIQIRKLYEPHLYPNAPVLPLFQEMFGNSSNEVCSVGFEANPLHDSYLKEFEAYCLKRGWRVKIFTSTAVSVTDGNVTFFIHPGDEKNNQWGASLEAGGKTANVTVPSINIVAWMKKTVLNRKLPPGLLPSKVMMKTDIEGHDQAVLANLLLSSLYCSIDLIYGEHLVAEFQNAVALFQRYSEWCKTKLIYMDDESYYQTRFPFVFHN